MKNSKLITLDSMQVMALSSKDLVLTTGGKSVGGTFTVDIVEGKIDAKGDRVPDTYSVHKYEINIDDSLLAVFSQYFGSKGGQA